MTKEEWVIAEKQAIYGYSGCKMLIDDYNITIILVPATPYKYDLAIYIDGKFKGIWLNEDCEERRRFCRPITNSLLKTKEEKDLFKGMSKKQREAWRKKARYTYYWPYWNSFASLKRHLIVNNKSIELAKRTESDIT